ncbi:MAG: hypothetical protein A2173_11475 [Planctomycetes bacterium RBG_13_44_8b]|nr:MAG: hypothetical protein A2173_11475 [Planctomycetes bacterium RBG_13_44_8b]
MILDAITSLKLLKIPYYPSKISIFKPIIPKPARLSVETNQRRKITLTERGFLFTFCLINFTYF